MNKIKRIAIWSGPRNLSTALMRSFGNRIDFEVIDEPFYAAYLKETGIKHPMYAEIIDSQISDPDVICELCKNGPVGKPYQYQKHMTHHMVKKFNRDFIFSLTN
ncbi:MAG: HAD family hydrolase, partial [Pseudomonadota bacterium]|nr:HAD family hydrolase [Pseudomonadota bacterium]